MKVGVLFLFFIASDSRRKNVLNPNESGVPSMEIVSLLEEKVFQNKKQAAITVLETSKIN